MELKNPSDNLHIYKQVSSVPEDAQKPFESSWGKKLTEINSMWRIQKLTELFGPCGEGWFTEVTRQERVDFPNGEVCVFTDINLYLKDTKSGRWSKPIRGTGGNRLVLKNADGLFIDDEAYKKAYTDALGIACKALGFGADIYWGRNDSKYDSGTATTASPSAKASDSKPETAAAPQKTETTENVKGLPELSPSHPRWDAFISWAAKKPKDKPSWQLRSAIRKQWTITDANFTELMRLAGRAS
ncbi:MAG: hypothetical protein ACI4QG_02205 [Candidatus Cryptobacteroides sp.]